jgi:hypothetical protein
VRIEGRAALDLRAYQQLVWASGKGRLLKVYGAALLIAVGVLLLTPAAGAVLLAGLLVGAPLSFELSLRRVWRRLSAGGPAVEIGYELTDEGMTVRVAGVSTQHRWESLRPLRETARYWLFQGLVARRAIAVPREAFCADARAEVDAVFARLGRQAHALDADGHRRIAG